MINKRWVAAACYFVCATTFAAKVEQLQVRGGIVKVGQTADDLFKIIRPEDVVSQTVVKVLPYAGNLRVTKNLKVQGKKFTVVLTAQSRDQPYRIESIDVQSSPVVAPVGKRADRNDKHSETAPGSSTIRNIRPVALKATHTAGVFAIADYGDCSPADRIADYFKNINEKGGSLTLRFLIADDGRVADAKIETSSGEREVDKASVSAIAKCLFADSDASKSPQGWIKLFLDYPAVNAVAN